MPEYIIHIGPPKSGSKFIQSQLFHNRQYLEENGVLYPDNWWRRPDQIFHDAILGILREKKEGLKEEFEKINSRGFAKIILSCEGFDGLSLEQIERFRDAIGDNPVRIVYYIRRWSDRIPSDWRQWVMMGQLLTFPEYYARFLLNPAGAGEFNYSLAWDSFAKVFGRQALNLVSYSNLADAGVNLFAHFCQAILGLPGVPETRKGLIQHNKGPSMIDAELLRALNYLYFLETSSTGIRIRIRFLRLRSKYDLGELYKNLEADDAELRLNDYAIPLATTWEAISAYKDRLISPEYGAEMFDRRDLGVKFYRQNYLMRPGVLDRLASFYDYVKSTPLDVQELRALG
jgi:hypothetical protein